MQTCNAALYDKVLRTGCPPRSGACGEGEFLVEGVCLPNDRRLDYVRCFHANECGTGTSMCDTLGCDGALCELFSVDEVLRLTQACSPCPEQPVSASRIPEPMLITTRVPLDSVAPAHPAEGAPGPGRGGSLVARWRALSEQKSALAADFLLEGERAFVHSEGTDAAFAAVAGRLARPSARREALIDLPLRTAYEEVCCVHRSAHFPTLVTAEFVEDEYARQLAFGGVSCNNDACGAPPQ